MDERESITPAELERLLGELTDRDNVRACAASQRLVAASVESPCCYPYFAQFASLLEHPNSLVRNRAILLIAACARWDTENRVEGLLPQYLRHITDPKPITARQCIKALPQIAAAKPQLIPQIAEALHAADGSGYADSMRPLIEQDIAAALAQLAGDPER